MSRQNRPDVKRGRRSERGPRKALAALRIPFGGVVVDRGLVLQHRYNAIHNLPFSPTVAAVLINSIGGSHA